MKLATIEQIQKLKQSGPRKKDQKFWEISRKDINNSNYNIWLCWIESVISWLDKRKKINQALL